MHPPFEYLGYTGSVAFCAIDRHYSGFIEDTSDQITYEAANLEGLRANFEAAVDEYVRLCIDLSAGAGGEPGGEGQMSIHVSACAADCQAHQLVNCPSFSTIHSAKRCL